jgi:hypothetical protein
VQLGARALPSIHAAPDPTPALHKTKEFILVLIESGRLFKVK